MVKFVYNNSKNISTGHTPFELNYKYHLYMFYKEDINSLFKFKAVDKI